MSWLYLSNPCALFLPIAHGACGCRRRPVFPAPSGHEGATKMQDSGESRAVRTRACVLLRCHRPRRRAIQYSRDGVVQSRVPRVMTPEHEAQALRT